MQKTKSVFRTNVIYGVLVLVPLAVIVLLLAKIVEILESMAEPFNLESTTSVIGAVILGIALLFAAEYLRRKPGIGMQGWFTVPAAFASGGIASLYVGVVAAHVMYELTDATFGFVSMAVVSLIAMACGLLFGPILAVVGVLGAFVSPLFV